MNLTSGVSSGLSTCVCADSFTAVALTFKGENAREATGTYRVAQNHQGKVPFGSRFGLKSPRGYRAAGTASRGHHSGQ